MLHNLASRSARASETFEFFRREVDRLAGELLDLGGVAVGQDHPLHPMPEGRDRLLAHAIGEVAHGLTVLDAHPPVLERSLPHLAVRLLGLLGRRAVPPRVADLLEPRFDHLVAAQSCEHRRGRLARAGERRDEDLAGARGAQEALAA